MSGNDHDNTDAANAGGVMDALGQQDRLTHEAWMLPTDKPLTREQIDGVRQAFQDRILTSKLSLAKVADQVGYSGPVLSEWASGKYAGDVDKVTRAINLWVFRESRRAANASNKEYVKTRVAENMRSLIRLADEERSMCVIVGPSGCGKTLVLVALKEELNAVYISLEDGMTPTAFLRRLCAHLGLTSPTRRGVKDLMHMSIVSVLRQTRQVIIIDEAQHLRTNTLSTVRAIHDQTGVMIVMAGSADFLDRLDDRADGRGQFSSRCVCLNLAHEIFDLSGPTNGTRGDYMFSVDEVKAFFDRRAIKLQRDSLEMLWALACLPGWGSFRILDRIASIARRTCDGRTLTRADVRAVLQIIMPKDVRAIDRLTEMHIERATPSPRKIAASA